MDRAEAVSLLSNCENGTFLVRVSKSAERLGEYSLSIVYAYPRHIRIQRFPLSDGSTMAYGLCELEQFPTIPVSKKASDVPVHHKLCTFVGETLIVYFYGLFR